MFTFLYKAALTSLLVLSVGCTPIPKNPTKSVILYTSDWESKWKEAKLKECEEQVFVIVLNTFKVRKGVMTIEELQEMYNWLSDRCVSYHKLDV